MAHIERIMREGTGADRQLAVFQQTNDMKAVVDQIVTETYEGLAETKPGAAATAEASS
jgi:carboxylate-amine ligase